MKFLSSKTFHVYGYRFYLHICVQQYLDMPLNYQGLCILFKPRHVKTYCCCLTVSDNLIILYNLSNKMKVVPKFVIKYTALSENYTLVKVHIKRYTRCTYVQVYTIVTPHPSYSLTRYLCIAYHISLINTAFSFSTPVQYYLNTNNIDIVVIFINSTPSNSTACHFATLDIMENYHVMMIISSIALEL